MLVAMQLVLSFTCLIFTATPRRDSIYPSCRVLDSALFLEFSRFPCGLRLYSAGCVQRPVTNQSHEVSLTFVDAPPSLFTLRTQRFHPWPLHRHPLGVRILFARYAGGQT